MLSGSGFGSVAIDEKIAFGIGAAVADGCVTNGSNVGLIITMHDDEEPVLADIARATLVTKPPSTSGPRISTTNARVVELFSTYAVLNEGSGAKRFTDAIYRLDRTSTAAMLRGLFTADGTVANSGKKSQYVSLDSCSIELLRQVQYLLLSFGIKSKLYSDRRTTSSSMCPDGTGSLARYNVMQMHSLRVSRSSRKTFEREIGFHPASHKAAALKRVNETVACYADTLSDEFAHLVEIGEANVYDLTERDTSHFVANGLRVHNCSEYIFIDDTACNLSSMNLVKFETPQGGFDATTFRRGVPHLDDDARNLRDDGPDAVEGDRREKSWLSHARPRLRQPRNALDAHGLAVRFRRSLRLVCRNQRAHDRCRVSNVGRNGATTRSFRALSSKPRTNAARRFGITATPLTTVRSASTKV